MLIPWSTFWERNYFVEWSPALEAVLTSNYLRGAISGLGLVNIAVGLVELGDSLASKASQPPADDQP
ncbi:MAG: hypothetical protein Q8T13_12445 [Acidobacteriota bacterium]|nr:hypothetical protein [Acidobacteriota bacterium]